MKRLRLHKCRIILQSVYSWYLKRSHELSTENLASLEMQMTTLEKAIESDQRDTASPLAESLEEFAHTHCKKSFMDYIKEVVIAIMIALVLAVVVRQMWFELYEIPTGSMRPTFREQDRVAVTKTPFGLNFPLSTGHFLFDPALVHRGGAITFTSEGIARLDEDTTFMWVIPYKKRLIKRLIGKPGDSLYFYGGKIYGVDREGAPIQDLIEAPWMKNGKGFDLEHIPMIRFSGHLVPVNQREVRFSQMGLPIGRLLVNGRDLKGEIFDGKQWIPEEVTAQSVPHDSLKAYSDFFGMRNFAMARLLTPQELQQMEGIDSKNLPKGVLYLELSHHPSLTYPIPTVWQSSRHPILLSSLKTVIPLNQEQLDLLMDHMYTARLVFKNGRATRYSVEAPYFDVESPMFPGVPDGTYEFYDGKLVSVGWGAITHPVDRDHPLYSHDPKNIQKLFNFGIEMHGSYGPDSQNQWNIPSRYVYFRDGDLYALGALFLKKGDSTLEAFNSREENKEKNASKDRPYAAFKDYGAPIKNGAYDVETIRTFGVTVPEKHYLVLGDNHAMSADSRDWGFVPEDNLQGAPSLILWPPGARLGIPWQAPYAIFTLPRLIVWSIAAITAGIWYFLHRRYLHRPIVLKKPLV